MNDAANRLLRSRRMTQVRLEELTGVDQSLISRYFNDHIVPKFPNAQKLALALGVTLGQFYDVVQGRWPDGLEDQQDSDGTPGEEEHLAAAAGGMR